MPKIYPSLISGKLLELNSQIKILEQYCNGFHVDVMDMHFVPNLTIGPDFINEIEYITQKQLWIHLMVDDPEQWLSLLKLKPQDIISFHYESLKDYKKIIKEIHAKKCLASIAIKPETKIRDIFNILPLVDQVLVMSVKPGFSGQKFITETINKIKNLAEYKKTHNLNFSIAIDGGINTNNIAEISNLGVEDFAIASAIFKTDNPINAIEELYELLK